MLGKPGSHAQITSGISSPLRLCVYIGLFFLSTLTKADSVDMHT